MASASREREKILQRQAYIQHKHAINEEGRQEIIKVLHQFIANEVYLNIIKQVIIYTSKVTGNKENMLSVKNSQTLISVIQDIIMNFLMSQVVIHPLKSTGYQVSMLYDTQMHFFFSPMDND